MCTQILFDGADDLVENFGELRATVPGVVIRWYPDVERKDTPNDHCLCGVDVRATLEAAGYDVTEPYQPPEDSLFWLARKQ